MSTESSEQQSPEPESEMTTTTLSVEESKADALAAIDEACNRAAFYADLRLAELEWSQAWADATGASADDASALAEECAREKIAAIEADRVAAETAVAEAAAAEQAAREAEIDAQHISLDEFHRIEMGMTYQQVVDIIGSEGELSSESQILDTVTKGYVWEGRAGFSFSVIVFQNGQVTAKNQSGL